MFHQLHPLAFRILLLLYIDLFWPVSFSFVVFITMFYLLYPLAFRILLLLYIDLFWPVFFSLLSLSQGFIYCTLWHSASCYYYTLVLSDQYLSLCCLYHNVSSVFLSCLHHFVTIIHWFFQTSFLLFVVFIKMFHLLYPLAFLILLLLYIDSFRLISISLLSLSQCFMPCSLLPSSFCYYYTLILSDQYPSLCYLYHNRGVSSCCNGLSDGLQNWSMRVHTPVALLHSLSDKYPWERYEPPYPSSYGLNSSTTVLLGEWLWH